MKSIVIIGCASDLARAFLMNSYHDYEEFILVYREKDEKFESLIDKTIKKKVTFIYNDFKNSFKKENFKKEIFESKYIDLIFFQSPKPLNKYFHEIQYSSFLSNFKIQNLYSISLLQFIIKEVKPINLNCIFILSIYVKENKKYIADYILSKSYNENLMKILSLEYPRFKFNCLYPTMIETKFLDNLPKFVIEKEIQSFKDNKYINSEKKLLIGIKKLFSK